MASKNNKNSQKSPTKPAKKTRKQEPDPEAKAPVEPINRPKALTVVGIGASAGGLPALRSFFEALPSDSGLAFVVVTHLHPEHESHMAELLQKSTQMPTIQVNKKIKVESDHVYVIPPNRSILMADTYLETAEFTEPHGRRTPIDHFFRSLARGHSESVAVILSGGGTDGSVGVKDIKEQGGLILVQHPDDAEYDSMPRAALSTGLADVVLPAPQLAEKLAEYIRHQPQLPHDVGELTEQEVDTLQRILAQVHARTGHDFNQYKRSTILRRVERRMQLNGFTTLEAYLNYLRHSANEAQAMFNDILIGVTNFFRDHESWQALEIKAIPAIFQQKDESNHIRIWSVGCATGEEAYSLAILLFEYADRLDFRPHIQVFASDLDDGSIAHARDGLYPAAIEADVSPERLERFFTEEGEYYRVKRELRDAVLFTNHNALRDPPFSRQDMVACRNVLIYLQRDVQDDVFNIFHYALNPGGYLFLGSSESAEHLPELFQVMDKTHRIYQAKAWVGERPPIPSMPLVRRAARRSAKGYDGIRPHLMRFAEESDFPGEEHRRALESYGPPNVLIDNRATILHVSETAGRYLLQPKGTITGDLLKLVRPELQLELRTAIFHAFEKDQAIVTRPVLVQFNGHARRVLLAVRPHAETTKQYGEQQKQALVFFIEDTLDEPAVETESETGHPHDEVERNQFVAQLQAQVQRLREQLQVTIEEYDSSNEEMKAANEELQSINEEYRSATEELETSREELQSVNEELQTVNSDMRNKLDELARAHEELDNLLGATEIGILFLDRELRIQRFTTGMNEIFNFMPGDRDRPIRHLTHKLKYDRFTEDAELVMHKLVQLEQEVQTENGNWFLLRMRPFRSTEDRIEGVVCSFVDINKLKKAEDEILSNKETLELRVQERTRELDEANQKISQARDLFEIFFEANPVPVSITRLEDGLIFNVNDAYLQYFNLKREDVIGHTIGEFNLPINSRHRPRLIARLQKEGIIRNIELEITHPSGEKKTVLSSMQIVTVDDTRALMLAFGDITERVRAEHKIRTAVTSASAAEQMDRQRISQILHDELQQNIFAVKMQLSFLADALKQNNPEAASVDLQQLDQWLAEAIATTRQLSIDLSPPVLRGEGLTESLLWLASQMKTQYNLDVTIEPNGTQVAFEDDVRSLLFQSVRELLFNVVKHSGSLEAHVALEQMDGQVNIVVSDKGRGFDMQEITESHLNGLKKMRDRLFLLGCNLEIESEPDKGTRITIEAPIVGPME
ncbi:MAG TPA: CheR family methyltransferase [Anaerolineales bacterium]|nr:CheR family methyltransferase [Anaerolineales bacterium]